MRARWCADAFVHSHGSAWAHITMCPSMLLQVLRAFEALSTNRAAEWLQWRVDSNVARDMVTLTVACATLVP